MKNKNLTITIILAVLLVLTFLISIFFNTIIYTKVYYDKPIKIKENLYEIGIINLKNNFFMPQTITLDSDYYCISYIDNYNQYEKNNVLYSPANIVFENAKETWDYNKRKIIVTIPSKKEKNVKILVDLKNFNSLNYKNLTLYVIKTEEKYFDCYSINYQNNYEIIKKYELNS